MSGASGLRRPLVGVLLAVALVGAASVYGLALVLSESRTYTASSVDHLLLTPRLLKELPLDSQGVARYTYSAADGPKPAVTTVELTARGERVQVERSIGAYLAARGFAERDPGSFSKGRREVQVEYGQSRAGGVDVRVADVNYLD